MAVAITATDGWIQHLPFVGGQRPSPYGQVDGIWYGLIAGDGDAGGGNFTINGRLSEDRKEDWVYLLGNISSSLNTDSGQEGFTQVNTGPLIPTEATTTTVRNPSFTVGGTFQGISNGAITTSQNVNGGIDPRAGMPIFGDKRIPGIFLMLAALWQNNVDGTTYQMSAWGWLIKYESFFRNVRPAVG